MRRIRRRGKRFETAAAFALGATAGSLATLLYAPASGQVLRRRLTSKARRLQRRALRQLGHTKRVLANEAGRVREAATEWISGHVPPVNNGRHAARRRTIRHAHAHAN